MKAKFLNSSEHYYFDNENFLTIKNKQVNAVLMGDCGWGKTLLLNKLCGTNFKAGITNGSSLTKQINPSKSLYSPNFYLFDTPGTTSSEEIKKHALLLKASLEIRPMNAIFIISEFFERIDDVIDHLKSMYSMVECYKENIIFMISKFDRCDE